jgi:hypothetical protein
MQKEESLPALHTQILPNGMAVAKIQGRDYLPEKSSRFLKNTNQLFIHSSTNILGVERIELLA